MAFLVATLQFEPLSFRRGFDFEKKAVGQSVPRAHNDLRAGPPGAEQAGIFAPLRIVPPVSEFATTGQRDLRVPGLIQAPR